MRRAAVLACAVWAAGGVLFAGDPPPAPVSEAIGSPKSLPPVDETSDARRPYPISLPTAFRLADARALDVALAAARVRAAAAALDRAELLWLPNIVMGSDYTRHDGQIQDIRGNVFGTSRSAVFLGAGPNLNVAVADALFAPLSARQVVRSRQADLQATANDTVLSVAEAYFNVQQARGELSGAESNVRAAQDLVRRTEALAQGLAPPVEANRARAELSRRRQTVASLRERWLTASAELARILRLDAAAQIEPLEPPALQITIIDPAMAVDDLIAIGLTNRPELASRQALVRATLAQLRQEKWRPLVPSVLLRGISTSNPGLAGGVFGGGTNAHIGNFSARSDWDVQLVWELQNLGLGNRARARERQAEYEAALVDSFRVQDRVAAEVAQAFAQVQSARERQVEAAAGLHEAQDTLAKSIEGISQTRRVGEFLILIVRPSEAVQAVQALAQAYTDFYAAVADYNRAQFRLYRALGHPAQCLAGLVPEPPPAVP